MIFHKSEWIQHKDEIEQVLAPDQLNQDKSFYNQNMCNKEGL